MTNFEWSGAFSPAEQGSGTAVGQPKYREDRDAAVAFIECRARVFELLRYSVVFARHQTLTLVPQHVQRCTNLASGLGGIDDGIDKTSFGRDVGIEQALGVVPFELGFLFVGGASLQDGSSLTRTHHCELGPRPRQTEVVPHFFGVHDDVGTAIRLAQDDTDAWHGRSGIREHQLCTMSDHSSPLQILAGIKTRSIDESDDRNIERIAEGNESSRFLGGGNVECACQRHRLIGDNSNRVARHARKTSDDVGGPSCADFVVNSVVRQVSDHLADVVAAC